MGLIERLIDIAAGEIGYMEKASNAHLDDKEANAGPGNYTKYARDMDALKGFYNGPKQGYAWCDVFVDWCFVKCFGADVGRRMLYQPLQSAGAGCTYSYQYFKAAGALYHDPEPGDQIFFGSTTLSTHTGIVVDVDGQNVYTVEGNSGDAVQKRSYPLTCGNIVGYGRPDWDMAPNDENDTTVPEAVTDAAAEKNCTVLLPELSVGSNGKAVATVQFLLDKFGIPVGRWGVDGDFGEDTKKAVLQFQARRGLEQDGIVGENTWHSLLTE